MNDFRHLWLLWQLITSWSFTAWLQFATKVLDLVTAGLSSWQNLGYKLEVEARCEWTKAQEAKSFGAEDAMYLVRYCKYIIWLPCAIPNIRREVRRLPFHPCEALHLSQWPRPGAPGSDQFIWLETKQEGVDTTYSIIHASTYVHGYAYKNICIYNIYICIYDICI